MNNSGTPFALCDPAYIWADIDGYKSIVRREYLIPPKIFMPNHDSDVLPKGVSGGSPAPDYSNHFGVDLIMKFKEKDMLQKQKGFTLLELLVVITLLAVLSVGALVAYEGLGENASNVAAANNIKTADSSIRAFRAIENKYPNQWDNLANLGGETDDTGAHKFLAPATRSAFGQWSVTDGNASGTVFRAVAESLFAVGINEFQTLEGGTTFAASTAPNLAFNESAPGLITGNPADELEFEFDDDGVFDETSSAAFHLSIVPSGGDTGACTADDTTIASNFNGVAAATSAALNLINDGLDDDVCHLVLALGFGKDVPGTTLGSRVAISTAPTYTNGNVVNPSVNYARYIALFHVASAPDDVTTAIPANGVLAKPRLIAVVDTEGRTIDQAIAGAFASN